MDFNVKDKVKEYYGNIASKISNKSGSGCGCGSSCCGDISRSSIIYEGETFDDIPSEAVEASLGCANPLLFAQIKEGETVLDLGSGGGINVLMASKYVGKRGKIYGLDMTDEMLALANKNKEKMGAANVEFLKGFIENIPLPDKTVDVIVSNCVINLSEDKEKALSEAYRVLKSNGRLAIADIIAIKAIPSEIRDKAGLWCGCLGGALELEEYKNILGKVGFKNIEIEPAHIYTKSTINSYFSNNGHLKENISDVDSDIIDGAFAGAYIKAEKCGDRDE